MKKLLFILTLLLASGGVALAENPSFTLSASSISDTKATLNVEMGDCCNENADNTHTYYFEYGTTTSVSKKTERVTLNWADDVVNPYAVVVIRDLHPNTKYYYRFVRKTVNLNSNEVSYMKSDLNNFTTLDHDEEPDEENDNELTDAQIDGLENLGFTDRQIKMIVALFAKKDHDGPNGLACGYRHKMILRHGMFGEDVKEMQKALKLNADGKFGRMTLEAVKRFQSEHGLHADGVVGQMTGLKLGLLCHME